MIYDISDEPEMQKQDSRAWNSEMLDALISVDKYRHIYGETAHSASPDFTGDQRTSWIPTEYISPMETTLDKDYDDKKPIVDVETAYYPFWYGSNAVEKTRVEGWYGLLGGLAGLVHLNSHFSMTNPAAAGTDTLTTILPQKRLLMSFMNSLDFIRMAKFSDFTVADPEAISRGIADTGKCYALYIFHGTRKWEPWPQGPTASLFNVNVGKFQDTVQIVLPKGDYKAEWIRPASGELIESSNYAGAEGKLTLQTPRYEVDIALRMKRLADPVEPEKR